MAFNNSEKQVKSKGGEHLDYLSGLTNWVILFREVDTKIVRDYICITATSVPSEQAFSKSGELISKRNRLGDHSIEARMCLNSWIALLDSNKCI
ncbi:ribonuclease H-like domain-containing protein [Rhizophagus irregularis DAOM 181602=DAOM 197198]|nr:ribonuclease H-like domain-containing protein [Rhizophagus irregularis DAOM 181602=DAOM 197198]